MADRIKDGDIVDVVYCDTGLFRGATVISTPGGPGELWCFKTKEGDLIAQNPSSTNLDYIIKKA